MNLKDILMMMPDKVLDAVEGIEYLDSPEDFLISIATQDSDNYTQMSKIYLWGDGTTNLHVGDTWDTDGNKVNDGLTFDETIEIYVAIRGIWQKNNV